MLMKQIFKEVFEVFAERRKKMRFYEKRYSCSNKIAKFYQKKIIYKGPSQAIRSLRIIRA